MDQEEQRRLLNCFRMPSGLRIRGRASSIRNVFVAAIVPVAAPSAEEIRQVLDIFGLEPHALLCSYCGERATEWDHLRPLVLAGRPTCRGGRAICSGSKAGAEGPRNSAGRPAPGKRSGAAPKAGVPNAQRCALGWSDASAGLGRAGVPGPAGA